MKRYLITAIITTMVLTFTGCANQDVSQSDVTMKDDEATAEVEADIIEGSETEDSKAEDSKTEDSKAEDSKAEDSKAEDSKAEDLETESTDGQFVSEWADPSGSKVYMTKDISPEGLMAVYEALGVKAEGEHVAVKLSIGEPESNYLEPSLIKDLVQEVDGTIVECNTAYSPSARSSTERHMQVAKDHGYTDIADVDIMDANGSVSIPIEGGKYITEDFVGANFPNYDYFVVLSHFKGHEMAGFGGAIKNISIGIASKEGKCWIHTSGKGKSSMMGGIHDNFLESMADAGKGVSDSLNGNILYINVMNKLSIDCDCNQHPMKPNLDDIGILASLDPVALDQACVDQIYAAPRDKATPLISRMEKLNGFLTLQRGEENGLGSRHYDLVNIDD